MYTIDDVRAGKVGSDRVNAATTEIKWWISTLRGMVQARYPGAEEKRNRLNFGVRESPLVHVLYLLPKGEWRLTVWMGNDEMECTSWNMDWRGVDVFRFQGAIPDIVDAFIRCWPDVKPDLDRLIEIGRKAT